MKLKKVVCFAIAAALLLLLAACAAKANSGTGEEYALYYKSIFSMTAGDDAIVSETVTIDESNSDKLAETILQRLLDGPESESMQTPFPVGTRLDSLKIASRHADVDLSAAYSRLSGIDLTIADYCITLSLTQLDSIGSVSITVNGEDIPYRDSQHFMANDVLLSSMDDVSRVVTAQLYFADASGQLRSEERDIELYDGESQADKLMEALISGPSDETLAPVFPEGVRVISTRVEDGICYLNLSEEFEKNIAESSHQQNNVIYSIVKSLCSVNEINEVQIVVKGVVLRTYGSVDISHPLN